MEIQTYMHVIMSRKLQNCNTSFLDHLCSCVLKLMSLFLHEIMWAGMEFLRDAPAKEKLVLNRTTLGLGSILDRDGAQLLCQIIGL